MIEIEGVKILQAIEHTVIPDRIEAGTLMVAAGLTRGNIKILNCPLKQMEAVVNKLRESGMEIDAEGDGVRVVGGPKDPQCGCEDPSLSGVSNGYAGPVHGLDVIGEGVERHL